MFTQIFGRVLLETPKYETINFADGYEIRNYPPCMAAQVTTDLSQVKDADDHNFDILADYIGAFGNPKNAAPKPIAMTVPVITKESVKIAMTAPVVMAEGGASEAMTMQFLLPEKYRWAEEAPRPLDERVELKEVGERKYGVVRHRGVMNSLKEKAAAEELRWRLERDGYRVVGEVVLVRYDPPWTLPFLRTNDIMVPIQ